MEEAKQIKKNIDKLMENAKTLVVITDNGAMFNGSEFNIMSCLAQSIRRLYERDDIHKDTLKELIEASVATDKELKEIAKKVLEEVKEKIDEMKGDNE